MNQADEAWVQELYRYNAPKLYKVVLRRLEDAEAAQDIVQDVYKRQVSISLSDIPKKEVS